jgi:hypothetical protein
LIGDKHFDTNRHVVPHVLLEAVEMAKELLLCLNCWLLSPAGNEND